MGLNYKNEFDRQVFKNVMKFIDPNNRQRAQREDILDFFEMPGFLKVANKCNAKLKGKNLAEQAMLSGSVDDIDMDDDDDESEDL